MGTWLLGVRVQIRQTDTISGEWGVLELKDRLTVPLWRLGLEEEKGSQMNCCWFWWKTGT